MISSEACVNWRAIPVVSVQVMKVGKLLNSFKVPIHGNDTEGPSKFISEIKRVIKKVLCYIIWLY